MYEQNNLGSYGGLGFSWGDANSKVKVDDETRPTDKVDLNKHTKKLKAKIAGDGPFHPLPPMPDASDKTVDPRHLIVNPVADSASDQKPEPRKHPHHRRDQQAQPANGQAQASEDFDPEHSFHRARRSEDRPFWHKSRKHHHRAPKIVNPDYYIKDSFPDISVEDAGKELNRVVNQGLVPAESHFQKIPEGKVNWKYAGPRSGKPVYSNETVPYAAPAEYVPPVIFIVEPVDILDLPPLGLSGFGEYVSSGLGQFTVGSAIGVGAILAVLSLLILGWCRYNKKP